MGPHHIRINRIRHPPATWYNARGEGHRIDYPLAPQEWKSTMILPVVLRGLDLTMDRLDHTPVGFIAIFPRAQGAHYLKRRANMMSVETLHDADKASLIEEVLATTPYVPRSVDPDTRNAIISPMRSMRSPRSSAPFRAEALIMLHTSYV
eukprot:8311352-Alexandrium_andersonii.AAC.1